MRKLLLLIPLIAFLTACQSKKEICARWAAAGKYGEVYAETKRTLGLGENDSVESYCEYYTF